MSNYKVTKSLYFSGINAFMVNLQDTGAFADEELFNQYLSWTSNAIKDMKSIYDNLDHHEGSYADVASQFYDLSHNIKGMGASFNFLLMTQIGTSLCSYLQSYDDKAPLSKTVLNAHIRALEVVLDNRILGDGGEKGNALLSRLEMIVNQGSSN